MHRKAAIKLRGVLDVQIWESRLKVTNLLNDNVFDQAPNIAIKTEAKGNQTITAYGDDALTIIDKDTVSFNPFSHPRMLLADVIAAQKLLKFIFNKMKSSWLFSPVVIIHPMEKVEGDLTYIERTGFRSLAKNAGAKEVYTYVGDEVSGDILKGIYSGQISHDGIQQLTETGT